MGTCKIKCKRQKCRIVIIVFAILFILFAYKSWYHLYRKGPTIYDSQKVYGEYLRDVYLPKKYLDYDELTVDEQESIYELHFAEYLEENFKYGSIGAEKHEGLPYWLWLVLPRLFPDYLPGTGGYLSFGMVWEEGEPLPVGISKKTIGYPRIGMNCAVCHTAAIRTVGNLDVPEIISGGASSQFNHQAYLRFLFKCADDARFRYDYIMATLNNMYDFSLFERLLYRFIIIPQTKKKLIKQTMLYAWMDDRPDVGPGRVDLFNQTKFLTLGFPIDDTAGTSDMMPLWNNRYNNKKALHWDGLNSSLREVVLSSAIETGVKKSDIDTKSLNMVEEWIGNLPSVKYADYFPDNPVNNEEAGIGEKIFLKECALCHMAGHEKTGTVIPISEIGTDSHRLDLWSEKAAAALNKYMSRYKVKNFKKSDGYVATLLDGVWLSAPYLHNGSVPTLYDLLEPPENRPKIFHRGYNVYDPVKVGFIYDVPDEGSHDFFLFDTGIPANGNNGHIYGTKLPKKDKMALIEYLKTL